MKNHLIQAIKNSSETRALFVLIVLLILRAWRAIPHLRPIHLILPATIAQLIVLGIAAFFASHLFFIYSIGLFIIVAVFMFPMLRRPQKQSAHWVKANE